MKKRKPIGTSLNDRMGLIFPSLMNMMLYTSWVYWAYPEVFKFFDVQWLDDESFIVDYEANEHLTELLSRDGFPDTVDDLSVEDLRATRSMLHSFRPQEA